MNSFEDKVLARVSIKDTQLNRDGTVLSYDGNSATVQWHTTWYVTGVTKQQLESGRYRLGKEI